MQFFKTYEIRFFLKKNDVFLRKKIEFFSKLHKNGQIAVKRVSKDINSWKCFSTLIVKGYLMKNQKKKFVLTRKDTKKE